ncbi:helix-turn-helix transcriptional regulator [Azohydromonas sp.]|uniref:helix-turn-helix domain-containing protein n=1 Tax=Azohydromonas sp. TaxID=1872666 RepID=UPI002BB08781|nr:helix-turn-helix transcriptional regulator [Azohydromonas sp.]HMM84704.1 helix-turn-helix transcriptional regulator [Azohydromonas sp.]
MDRATRPRSFGELLRRWRQRRGATQLALALDAGVSTRHLSWLETGRASPSRAMVLRLAGRLDVPLRERNLLLQAAGYAPLYAERDLADPALTPARDALQRLLDAHEPWPALAVDRHWNLVAANRAVGLLTSLVDPVLLQPPVNVLRLSLHPRGLAPMVDDLPGWRAHVLSRLRRQLAATGDETLRRLHDELRTAGTAPQADDTREWRDDVVAPLVLNTPHGRLGFVTTVTVFGAPQEVTLAELAVETLLPADTATAQALRRLLGDAR